MPLHLNSITRDSKSPGLLASLIEEVDNCETVLSSSDGKFFHLGRDIFDSKSGDKIGKFVFTVMLNEEIKALEMQDLDITLSGGHPVELRFLELLPGSSDSNEYYEVETVDEEQHLQIETVNRHIIDGSILDTVNRVKMCAFPFSLSVHESLDAFNAWAGFDKEIPVKGTEYKVSGFSPHFVATGHAMNPTAEKAKAYSFVIGTVKAYRDVRVQIGQETLNFVIAELDSALGALPTAMSREVFDLSKLAVGSVIAMYADVKADFAI